MGWHRKEVVSVLEAFDSLTPGYVTADSVAFKDQVCSKDNVGNN